MSSFKNYEKVNEADQARLEARRKRRKRITIISLSSILLVGIIVAAVVGTCNVSDKNSKGTDGSSTNSLATSIKAVCTATLYQDSCYSSLSLAAGNSTRLSPEVLFKLSLKIAMDELSRASELVGKLDVNGVRSNISKVALSNCQELIGLAIDNLNDTMSSGDLTVLEIVDDFKTWLSAAGTYQQTCIDGLDNLSIDLKTKVGEYLKNSSEFTSNSLAILTKVFDIVGSFKLRRLMNYEDLPVWVSSKYRKLAQSSDPRRSANVVVAKDGSGKYKSISAALLAVPDKSKERFVIYVKKGIYYENIRVEKSKWNVMIVGDGKNATIVSGNLNFVDGTPTFSSATIAVFGKNFVAQDMGFRNTAGAIKHQAVALMSSADQSIYFRCQIDGFQDSLYAHAQRQFYRECDIYGTVDFIFGNSAVVLQNCNIRPKLPMPGQQNTITAQGKLDPNQNTGISIQNCAISPAGNLTSVRTYLGRPWKPYSTTIYMQTMMGSLIDPAGWLPWIGDSAPDTIFYSEFWNFGPGSSTKNRVKWKGLKNNLTSNQASKFTVKSFIGGDKWITKAGVSYKPGL